MRSQNGLIGHLGPLLIGSCGLVMGEWGARPAALAAGPALLWPRAQAATWAWAAHLAHARASALLILCCDLSRPS